MSYGTNLAEMFYPSGVYIGCLLNGERPADLPVQQATKVELIINLRIEDVRPHRAADELIE